MLIDVEVSRTAQPGVYFVTATHVQPYGVLPDELFTAFTETTGLFPGAEGPSDFPLCLVESIAIGLPLTSRATQVRVKFKPIGRKKRSR